MVPSKTFRFDDISENTNPAKLSSILDIIRSQEIDYDLTILLCLSPLTFSRATLGRYSERVHPPKLTAGSSLNPYYYGTQASTAQRIREAVSKRPYVKWAGHGIVHVDHRLLSSDAQEISILTSCALAQSRIFVPPYNKWNTPTECICLARGIELVKFEDGWQHALHNPYDVEHELYYMHPYDFTPLDLEEWFRQGLQR